MKAISDFKVTINGEPFELEEPDFTIDNIQAFIKPTNKMLSTMTPVLPDSLLDVYQRAAYEALFATVKFPVVPAERLAKRSWFLRFRWRWIRRFERLASYRLVSMEDYHSRYDY